MEDGDFDVSQEVDVGGRRFGDNAVRNGAGIKYTNVDGQVDGVGMGCEARVLRSGSSVQKGERLFEEGECDGDYCRFQLFGTFRLFPGLVQLLLQ